MTSCLRLRCSILLPILASLGLSVAAPASAPVSPQPASPAAADAGLPAFVDGQMAAYMRDHDVPSIAVAIVQDGRLVFARGYGAADRATHRRVDAATSLFRIGSVSKLLTWTAVMQLVEQGRIDLDADVNRYLKGVRIPPAFGKPVTMRALMTHTAGFEDGAVGYLSTYDPKADMSIQHALAAHIPARIRPPLKIPAYSNYGAALAGLIVEQVSGIPFDDYVERNIFVPLGMRHSSFVEPLPRHLAVDQVIPYARRGGALVASPIELIAGFRPAGSVAASAVDMSHFMLAHLQADMPGAARILRPETLRLMHSTVYRADPRLPGVALGFLEGEINGLRTIGHRGTTDSFQSALLLVPSKKLGIFISYAAKPGSVQRNFIKAFMDRYYPAPAARDAAAPAIAEDLSRYVGSYRASRRSATKIDKIGDLAQGFDVAGVEGGRLRVSGLGDADELYAAMGDGLFRQIDGDRRIAFNGDKAAPAAYFATDSAPYFVAERVPWHENATLWWVILAASCLILLGMPIDSFAMRQARVVRPRLDRRIIGLSRGVAAAGLVTIAAVILALLSGLDHLEQIIPTSLRLALLMPILLLLLAVAALAVTIRYWRRLSFGPGRRTYLILTIAGAFGICLFLHHWNLFGWQFG